MNKVAHFKINLIFNCNNQYWFIIESFMYCNRLQSQKKPESAKNEKPKTKFVFNLSVNFFGKLINS